MHIVPSVSRAQGCVSVRIVPPQLPPLHTGSVQVRDWVPLSSQASLKPPQLPQPPHDVLPQPVPSVSREQPELSVRIDEVHVPDAQT